MTLIINPILENGVLRSINVEHRYPTKREKLLFSESDGDFRLDREVFNKYRGLFYAVSFKSDRVILARDILGSRPLYYNEMLEVSSFRRFVENARDVLPGEYIEIGYDGEIIYQEITGFSEVFSPSEFDKMEIEEKIVKSIEKRAKDFKNACISFSGGVDSSFLAYFYDLPLISVTASAEEEKRIKKSAKMLGRTVEIFKFDKEVVKNTLPVVINAIENSNPLQVSIAIPVHLSMNFAKYLGYDEIIFGQGADELFGGYKKYENLIGESLRDAMLEDLMNIGDNNLIRDIKLSYINEIKLITPYLDFDIIESALAIPPELKIFREGVNVIRKFFFRQMAKKFIPEELAYASKKAIQYSTKTYSMLEKIAREYKKDLKDFLRDLDGNKG